MSEVPHTGSLPGLAWLADDFQRRWRGGECLMVEAYLREKAASPGDDALLDLIHAEVLLREERGEVPSLAEYLGRFPHLAAPLREQFELHRGRATQGPLVSVAPVAGSGEPLPVLPGYEVLGELGKGGMGIVYKAWQTGLNRIVALKMIRPDAPAEALARFRTEAEAIARLKHPHIVQIYEISKEGKPPYCTLEYVEGGSLDKKIAGVPQPADLSARIVELIARAVHTAHEAGVVHRDLKPANVLLAADGTPRVADFGLAKLAGGTLAGQTQSVAWIGTPSYMAPEQAAGKARDVGPLTDVYGLGAILYECLSGRPPFRGETPQETLRLVEWGELLPPSRLAPRCPRDLETICLKCLCKEPPGRYASALALAEDLRRFLEGKPTLARPPSVGQRALKWARREPARAALLVLSVLVLLGLLGGGFWYAAHERQQAEEARAAEQTVRQLLAESYAHTAELAARRGDWHTTLEDLDRALAGNHRDPAGLRLEKVRAWCAVGEVPRAVAELEALAREENLTPRQRGLVLLWQGDFSLSRSYLHHEQARQLFDQALRQELPGAEAAYAQALRAPTAAVAVQNLEKALTMEPFHPRANAVLGFLLISLGELAQARDRVVFAEQLFPDDPTYKLLHASILALQNKREEVRALLDRADPRWRPQHRESARHWVATLHELQDLAKNLVDFDTPVWSTLPTIIRLVQRLPEGMKQKAGPNTEALFLPLPPAIVSGYLRFFKLAPLLLSGWDKDPRHIEEIAGIVRANPQGLLYVLHGMILVQNDRWAEAEAVFLAAARAPSIVPVRTGALFWACACESTLAQKAPPRVAAALRARALRNARECVLLGDLGPFETEQLSRLALNQKDLDLARALLGEWERQAPRDLKVLRRRAKLELLAGAYGRVLELTAKTTDKEMLGYRSQAIQHIRQQADKLGPR
jgi:tetratricopeptide (TPR) repeat protein/predicted Ser/Thr protein kinase